MLELVRAEEGASISGELASLSPLLASIDKKTPFSVPDGYFEELESILQNTANQKTPDTGEELITPDIGTPVVELTARRTGVVRSLPGRRILSLAAVVIVLLGVFTYFYSLSDVSMAPPAPVSISAELPELSTEELRGYLSQHPEPISAEPISLAGLDDIDFERILDNINEAELQEFMRENPSFQIDNYN